MKSLPQGDWITLNSLTPGTTEEDVQAYLAAAYVELPLGNIVVNENQKGAQAIVSLDRNDVAALLHRAIGDVPLNGRAPVVVYRTRSI